MSQSLANIIVHIIFSTKDRRLLISDEVRPKLHGYLAGILNNLKSPAIVMNSVADDVHILCVQSKNFAASKLIEEIKKSSSKWMKLNGCPKFAWQSGYGVFSVSPSNVDSVRKYIEDQERHHRRTTFKDEFRKFLKKYNVSYDERYVWE